MRTIYYSRLKVQFVEVTDTIVEGLVSRQTLFCLLKQRVVICNYKKKEIDHLY